MAVVYLWHASEVIVVLVVIKIWGNNNILLKHKQANDPILPVIKPVNCLGITKTRIKHDKMYATRAFAVLII